MVRDLTWPGFLLYDAGRLFIAETSALSWISTDDPFDRRSVALDMEQAMRPVLAGNWVIIGDKRTAIPDAIVVAPIAGPPTEAREVLNDIDFSQTIGTQGYGVCGDHLYWAEGNNLRRAAFDFVSGTIGPVLDVNGAYIASRIVTSATELVYQDGNVLRKIVCDTTPPTPVALGNIQGNSSTRRLTIAAGRIYQVKLSNELFTMTMNGADARLIDDLDPDATINPANALGVAADETHFYYVTTTDRLFRRSHVMGSLPELLLELPSTISNSVPVSVAVDDTYAYVAVEQAGEIWRVDKTVVLGG